MRFNAEKKAVGKYYTTTVWAFTMRTPCCGTEVEVRTDPQASDYAFVRGVERKAVAFDAADAGTAELGDPGERAAARAGTLGALDAAVGDAAAGRAAALRLTALLERSAAAHGPDYAANKALRRAHRAQRAEAAAARATPAGRALPEGVPLLPAAEEDAAAARAVDFGMGGGAEGARRGARRALRAASLLPSSASPHDAGLREKRRRLEAAGVRFGGGGGPGRAL